MRKMSKSDKAGTPPTKKRTKTLKMAPTVASARKPRAEPVSRESRKEELLSLNGQLNTVNQQLRRRVSELELANVDLNNLLNDIRIGKHAFELTRAEESERQAIARDLHDDLGQLLSVAKLKLVKLRDGVLQADRDRVVEEVSDLIGRAESSVRSLAFQLSPAVLYELGLVPALQWLAEDVKKTYGLSVELSDDGQFKPLSQSSRAVVFRAIRELLINVVKHAGVSTAYVGTHRVDGHLEVEVSDDGNGFTPSQIAARAHSGFGLTSVRERMSFIGGGAEISSMPGDGTQVRLTAPLQTPEQAEEEQKDAKKP
jgi:signal transduction histidine kinase